MKKTRIYAVIGIFIISIISNYIFELYPNILLSIFFPVNESIWERIKMIYTSIIIYSIIDKIILNKLKINYNNFNLQILMTIISVIPIYLFLNTTIYNIMEENTITNFLLLIITFILIQILSYKIMTTKKTKNLNNLYPLTIITLYIIFTYLTYYPPDNYLFYDNKNNMHGIKKQKETF